jgi:hypothetical protein
MHSIPPYGHIRGWRKIIGFVGQVYPGPSLDQEGVVLRDRPFRILILTGARRGRTQPVPGAFVDLYHMGRYV